MSAVFSAVAVVTGIGAICGLLLVIAAKFMYVPVDERASLVREQLPGANCGACGFAGCDDYAAAVAAGTAMTNQCVVGADAVAAKIAEVMGVEALDVVEMVGVVTCRGCAEKPQIYEYEGIHSCAAAAMLHGGPGSCSYGCVGFGDCVAACKFDAIHVINGVAKIDPSVCTGCGSCAAACPKQIIKMLPQVNRAAVLCINKDKGAIARKACTNACIGCMKCEKICPNDAIHVVNFCAQIDTEKCLNCRKCESECPTGAICIG